ncbi:MAG: hypothetical protein RIR19_8 [Chloroflexota bacterium]|jgi:predicted PurR-regulated permease PerM
MQLPSPLDARAWPQAARLVGWVALAAVALVAIFAGLSVVSAVVAAQGGIVYALIGGWILAALADTPINLLVRRGWPRGRAAAAVWILGAIPVLLVLGEIAVSLARSLGSVLAGPAPTAAEIADYVDRPAKLLRTFGIRVDLAPLARDLISALREAAGGIEANLAAIATGALSAIGPVVLAIGSGVILSASPNYLEGLESLAPKRRSASVRRSRLMLEELLARFIGRHLLLGLVYGVVVYIGASLAGADGVLAGTLGGLIMAIPTLGQGPALFPPLLIALLAAGPYALVGIAIIAVAWFLCATWLAPRLLDSALRLPASTVFLAGTAGGIIGGPPGAIFSLPIIAAITSARRSRR